MTEPESKSYYYYANLSLHHHDTVTEGTAGKSSEGGGVNGIILPSTHTPRGCHVMRP